MPLIINGTEVEHVIFKAPGINQEIDEVYANSTLVFVSTIFVPKPTISGSFTFDNSTKTPTITGYDAAAMTQSGTVSATAAGSYSITYTLNAGYAWTDETTAPVTLNWSIAKRSITIPSISNTSKTYNANAQSPTIANVDGNYVTQSGTASATNAGSYTVTWALKYSASTTWTDNTTANKTGSWSIGKMSITIPSISNTSKTYNAASQSPTITGVSSTYVTQTGTASATNVGSYTVTWALKDTNNTQWSDKTTTNKTGSWSIGKLSITIPSLSGTTSFAYVQGATHSVTVSNRNTTYVNQSGNTSVTDGNAPATQTITWSLKDTANTQWTDKTTGNKTATWGTTWVNGTSHYSNDLYNKGWYKTDSLQFSDRFSGNAGTIQWNSDHFTIFAKYLRTTDWFQNKTVHFTAKAVTTSGSPTYPVTFYIYEYKTGSDWGHTTNTSFSTLNTDQYREYSGTNTMSSERHLGTVNGVSPGGTNMYKTAIQRIWVT